MSLFVCVLSVAKKKSLFDDRPVEIQELTYIIKQSIGQLNEQIAQLQRSQSGSKRREQEKKHSDNVVVSLQSKLANMSKEFKSVLEVRTQNLKDQQERREHYSTGPALAGSLDAPSSSGGAGSIALDLTGSNYQQMQQMQLVDKQDAYIRSREDAVTTIESTIVELGGIFQQLGTLIHEQGQMVERIDANIEETEVNINLAHSEIAKYFENISSNRWLMIKIFAVLIVFFIVFVVFFA
ncbi:syntaxin 5A [Capsaspora owczarzaki ATCC 30864]|uniref:Syntaxin 5A n=1 Tax=Capsaspora owczarzaki (strain ATCC 30864) TaxID=595528 RepID=A0A0D2WW75_CAPO3|nr:syntaxin 5A [Capsaspora owczarzaki ATCC 30864]